MGVRRISKISILLLTILVMEFWAGAALAQQRPGINPFVDVPDGCYLSEPPDTESLYSFTKMQVQALWMARRGEQANSDVLTSKEDLPMSLMAEMIRGMRQERIENACAAFVISAYARSGDQSVATTSKILAAAYQQLGKMSDQMLEIVLKGTQTRDQNFTRDQLSLWKNQRRAILAKMTEALTLSLSMLVDENRKNSEGKADHLILTRAQRDALLNFLNAKFPSLENEKKIGHSGDFLEQAIMIQSFLTGNYKPADSQ